MSEKSKLRELTSDEQNNVAGGIGESKPGNTTSDSFKALLSIAEGPNGPKPGPFPSNEKGWAKN